jgi:hypothetical protein
MKTRSTDRFKANVYIKRAEQCKNAMQRSFEACEWDACVSNAILCAISSADAYCVHKNGIRSAGDDHREAALLFRSTGPSDPDIGRAYEHLSKLLDIKSIAQYGDRSQDEKDAVQAVKHAERLFDFVRSKIQC